MNKTVDKATNIENEELLGSENYHKDRWKDDPERQDCLRDKLKLLLVIISFLVLLSLIAVATLLAWAYVERRQSIDDGAQLHEPTRLYSSTMATTVGKFFNSTSVLKNNNKVEDAEEQRSSIPGDGNEQMHLIRVYEGINSGAVCLDGTPPAYYLRPGKGLGTNRWIIHFNGGAWCFDEEACLERSRGSLGSTKHLPPAPPVIQGINSANGQINPDFYDWNLVWIVYCDGASFTGDRQEPVTVRGENIFFRGKRVLDAIIEDLLKSGIQNAEGIILTGSSAGSMTAMFAVDRMAERLPNVPMHVLSDAGYFIETQPIGGKSVGAMFKKIYDMQNSSNGLNKDCIRNFGIQKGWHCFLPQHTFKFIKHPVFVLNAAYDVWALLYFVGIDCKFPTVVIPNILKKSEINEKGLINAHITNHREVRDISGFEILPYFRSSKNKKQEVETPETINEDSANEESVKKSKIPKPYANDTSKSQEKRNFEPQFGEGDLVDAQNTFTLNGYADNYYNARVARPHDENAGLGGAKLHLNIDTDNSAAGNDGQNLVKKEKEFDLPSIQTLSEMSNVLANEKQEQLSLNPLASSVSTLSNVAGDVQKDSMDTETIGLLNEVFKKLKKLLPKKGANSTVAKSINNKTKDSNENIKLIGPTGAQKSIGNEERERNIDNQKPENIENQNKVDELLKAKKDKEKQKSKELTQKITQMLRTKQAELTEAKKLREKQRNKPGQKSSNEIIANMFKSAGKLPNFMNSKANHPVRLQDLFHKNSPGVNRNGIAQNKNKRSANIIKEYINILRSDPPECTENQMINVMKYRNAMLQATRVVKAAQSAGIFLVSCIEHSMSLFDETWTSVTIQQKSIQQAFGDWYYGRETNHYNIDGPYPSNPSCP
eukprot:Seg2479.1 transcript_id=Seg2479.1/GoldUCD/mRNA.D3Y31 product="Pectin acetylesterase 9" protein_id=Seg2479.1/GoldUCD/D3Y31